jgi:rod shape-determining protein MreD
MTLIVAAAGAAVAALVEITLWLYVDVGGAHPHLVFVVAVVWAAVASLEASLAWGFTGGLMLDVLAPRPLGATALMLLLIAGVAAGTARGFAQMRLRALAPIVIAGPLSVVYSLGLGLIVAGADGGSAPANPIPALVPGAVFDAVLVAAIVPIALAIRSHRAAQERVGW